MLATIEIDGRWAQLTASQDIENETACWKVTAVGGIAEKFTDFGAAARRYKAIRKAIEDGWVVA